MHELGVLRQVVKTVSRACVGRDADVILAKIGINVDKNVRCIICETDFMHDFVQHELMMPILPIVRVENIEQAIELAASFTTARLLLISRTVEEAKEALAANANVRLTLTQLQAQLFTT